MPRRLTESEHRELARWPEYRLEIPTSVTLECPECHSQIQCEVDLITDEFPRYAVAGIETWRCEDCGRLMCDACRKHRHPADRDLYQCDACREAAVSAGEAA
jgi:hypothetical protein